LFDVIVGFVAWHKKQVPSINKIKQNEIILIFINFTNI